MKAVVKSAPIDGSAGTEIRDCPVPKPGPDEVLIRVAAAAICGTDKHIYHWDPSIRDAMQPPRIYGHEFCGEVQRTHPRTMLASSTHDTKRSEDVRARIDLLSEIPERWKEAVNRWAQMNAKYKQHAYPDIWRPAMGYDTTRESRKSIMSVML